GIAAAGGPLPYLGHHRPPLSVVAHLLRPRHRHRAGRDGAAGAGRGSHLWQGGLMNTDARRDRPSLVQRLGVALRFLAAFAGTRVGVPLVVSIPARNLTALRWETDATYRFSVANQLLPTGMFDVAVDVPGGEYISAEPFKVQLPPPSLPHAPPLLSSDYLVEKPLWPTPSFRPPLGETAILGRINSSGGVTAVGGLKVFLFVLPGPPP